MSLDEVHAYDERLVAALVRVLGAPLVGVYVSGSVALGDYVPGSSDLDRFVVVAAPLARSLKEDVVAAARHEALPCPARGLELVVYSAEAAARGEGGADFELNLNTGARMPFHVAFDPAEEPAHWFVLDRAIVRERGWALVGPPPADVFAPAPRETVVEALAESLRWHVANAEVAGPNLVLNAVRAWRFAATGAWVSKTEAAAWALEHGADPGLVRSALAEREGRAGPPLDGPAAEQLVAEVLTRLAPERERSGNDVVEERP